MSVAKLRLAWRLAAGAAVARASLLSLDGDTLVVNVPDQHWQRELDTNRPLLLGRLTQLLGPDVRAIVVRSRPVRPGRSRGSSPGA
jgi:hypothetical protein